MQNQGGLPRAGRANDVHMPQAVFGQKANGRAENIVFSNGNVPVHVATSAATPTGITPHRVAGLFSADQVTV
jgi:hypothetical protein